MPVVLCSWYLSMSMCRLVVKNSSLAVSLWCMDTISIFCLDREELCLSKLMLQQRDTPRTAVCEIECVCDTETVCGRERENVRVSERE